MLDKLLQAIRRAEPMLGSSNRDDVLFGVSLILDSLPSDLFEREALRQAVCVGVDKYLEVRRYSPEARMNYIDQLERAADAARSAPASVAPSALPTVLDVAVGPTTTTRTRRRV
jgi:hypothetical protein